MLLHSDNCFAKTTGGYHFFGNGQWRNTGQKVKQKIHSTCSEETCVRKVL
jgi:hypothetical protein